MQIFHVQVKYLLCLQLIVLNSNTFSKVEENVLSTYQKPRPRFNDENAFAPDDGWRNKEVHELMDKKDEHKYKQSSCTNRNDPASCNAKTSIPAPVTLLL